MKLLVLVILLVCLLKINQAVVGVDVSQLFSTSTFQCMKTNGVRFSIPRGYCSYGGVDRNAVASLQNAKAAGLITDIYMFPCAHGKAAATQAAELASSIPASLYGMVWVDVEANPSSGCKWTDANSNCQFLQELVNALKGHGMHVGIYASSSQWQSIFGARGNCPYFTGQQLWYAHYDNNPSFSDFSSFGGWSKPNIKQYKGDTTLCGAGVDMDFYP